MNWIKSSVFLFLARLANPAATIAVGLYIAKSWGVEAFGHYSFIMTYCFLFSMIFSLGLATLITRDVAQKPDQAGVYFSNLSFLGLVSGLAGLFIMLGGTYLFHLPAPIRLALQVYSFSIFPSIMIYIWEGLFNTFAKNNYVAAAQFLEAALKIVASYFLLKGGHGLVTIMLIFLLARLVCLAMYYRVIKLLFQPRLTIDFPFIRRLLPAIPTFASLYLFSVLLGKTDLLFLAWMKDFHAVGIYSAAYKLLEITYLLPTVIITVLFPSLSRLASAQPEQFRQFSRRARRLSLLICIPVAGVIIALARPIMIIFYSPAFQPAVLCLRILIIGLSVYLVDQILAHSLIANHLQKYNLRTLILATVVNIGMNLVLIPRYSFIGASISTLAALLFMVFLHYFFNQKYIFRGVSS